MGQQQPTATGTSGSVDHGSGGSVQRYNAQSSPVCRIWPRDNGSGHHSSCRTGGQDYGAQSVQRRRVRIPVRYPSRGVLRGAAQHQSDQYELHLSVDFARDAEGCPVCWRTRSDLCSGCWQQRSRRNTLSRGVLYPGHGCGLHDGQRHSVVVFELWGGCVGSLTGRGHHHYLSLRYLCGGLGYLL